MIAPEVMEQNALSYTLPAPVLGWNTRDALDGMEEGYALLLDNYFPEERSVSVRGGYSVFATGLGGDVETLVEHVTAAGVKSFLAAANLNLWNVTTGTPASLASSLTNDRWQSVAMNNITVLMNGVDQPRQWNGSALSNATYSGISDDNTLIQGTNFRNRLYFAVKDSASVWYSSANNAVTGALVEFPLGFVFTRGGYVQFVTTWTRNSGEFLSETLVIVSSEGEVLVYAGPSPDDASFTLIGHIYLDKPLSRRAFLKRGSEVEILTLSGAVPLSSAMALQNNTQSENVITATIGPTFNSAAASYFGNFGFEAISYPAGKYALYNIPVSNGVDSHQYVRNIYTGAWCRFTGQAAACWALFNNDLYFGGYDGKIYLADSGTSDNSASIETDMRLPYSYLGSRDNIKQVVMARPVLVANTAVEFLFQADMDFETRELTDTITTSVSSGSDWDTSNWDTTDWADEEIQVADWRAITGVGRCMSLRLKADLMNVEALISAVHVIYKPGGYL